LEVVQVVLVAALDVVDFGGSLLASVVSELAGVVVAGEDDVAAVAPVGW